MAESSGAFMEHVWNQMRKVQVPEDKLEATYNLLVSTSKMQDFLSDPQSINRICIAATAIRMEQSEIFKRMLEERQNDKNGCFFKLHSGKIEKGTPHSACWDLFYAGETSIQVEDSVVGLRTGVKSEFSPGYVCIIKEKSGLAAKGVEVKAGVIDADYRDEWIVLVRKPGDTNHTFNPGDKVAQFMIVALPQVTMLEIPGATISVKKAERDGGFGSTGTR